MNKFILLLLVFQIQYLNAQTYVFARLDGSPTIDTSGWNLVGNAVIGNTNGTAGNDNDELILTQASNFQTGGIFWHQPIDLSVCKKWIVEYDCRLFDVSSQFADGLAFCFLDTAPSSFAVGGGIGIPSNANGLKVIIDTYHNCVSGSGIKPEIQLYSGVGYQECAPGIMKQPNTGGMLSFLRSNSYNRVKIVYDDGDVEIYVNNTLYLSGYAPANFKGYMGFTASTGSWRDRHSIMNVIIYTDQAPAEAGNDTTICSGESLQIGTANNVDYVYSWAPSTGLDDASLSNPTVTLTNNSDTPVVYIYTVATNYASNPNGCTTTDEIKIKVNPIPTSNFNIPDSACMGEVVNLTYNGNMGSNVDYNWDFDGGIINSGSEIGPYEIIWGNTGLKTVSLQVISNGCTSTLNSKNIEVASIPISNAGSDTSFCTGTSVQIGFINNPDYIYSWLPTAGLDNPNISNPTLTLNNSSDTPMTVHYTVKTNFAYNPYICSSSDEIKITVYPTPTSDFLVPDSICLGKNITINYNGNMGTDAVYNWLFEDGVILSGSGMGPYDVQWDSLGSKIISLQVVSNGCSSVLSSKNIFISESTNSTFVSDKISACENEEIEFTYTGSANSSSTYNWDFAGGNIQSGTGQGPISVKWASSGNYQVKLSVAESGCMSSETIVDINIRNAPVATFTADTVLCENQLTTLTYTGTNNQNTIFNWDFGQANVLSGSNAGPYAIKWSNPGKYAVGLTVEDSGCVSELFVLNFTVIEKPVADFEMPDSIATNKSGDFIFNGKSNPNAEFIWTFENGFPLSFYEKGPANVTWYDSGFYYIQLIVSNGLSCRDTISKLIRIYSLTEIKYHLPTGFSPNGDGLNEVFMVGGDLRFAEEFKMQIFNRWGELLFESYSPMIGWDGTYQNKPCPQEIYLALVNFRDPVTHKLVNLKIGLTLLR